MNYINIYSIYIYIFMKHMNTRGAVFITNYVNYVAKRVQVRADSDRLRCEWR